MSDEMSREMLEEIREEYNKPPEVPREAMWTAIAQRIGHGPSASPNEAVGEGSGAGVIDLDRARASREAASGGVVDADGPASREGLPLRPNRVFGWAVAAAAVLVLGIGIGRMTAPGGAVTVARDDGVVAPGNGALTLAAREHLGRTESLLTMVRADARAGQMDPSTARWAGGLLAETRLLLDSDALADPSVEQLLMDLELVLVQIVGVTETGSMDEAQARTELELTLRSLEEGEVLPRIRAAMPTELSGA